ncbi:MAG: FkbM family methyltransferase [Ignavibacteriaceae bacterium]
MLNFLKEKINIISRQVNDKNYREFLRLLIKFGSVLRNETKKIDFLNYQITVVDCLSFIYQFKEIFVKGAYLFKTENSSPLIYDCGANIGVSCLYFKSIYPNAKIKAFEADPSIAKVLEQNLKNNSIIDVEVISKAVWTNNGGVEFSSDNADGGSIFGSKNKTKVESIRLKNLLEKEDKINLLKIDIEGAEAEVLEDCRQSLTNVERIFVEYHGWKNSPQKLDVVLSILTENNFRYFIESISELEKPFTDTTKIKETDLQLNIYAVKVNES